MPTQNHLVWLLKIWLVSSPTSYTGARQIAGYCYLNEVSVGATHSFDIFLVSMITSQVLMVRFRPVAGMYFLEESPKVPEFEYTFTFLKRRLK